MGNEIRRAELRIARLEKAMEGMARATSRLDRLEALIGAVAESAGSALAVEALTELAGVPAVEVKMREVARRKQAEAEGVMAGRVADAVEAGRLVRGDVVGAQSLVVGERREGEAVRYRVDLHPAPEGYAGRRVGDVVEGEEGARTEIHEVWDVVLDAQAVDAPGETPAPPVVPEDAPAPEVAPAPAAGV